MPRSDAERRKATEAPPQASLKYLLSAVPDPIGFLLPLFETSSLVTQQVGSFHHVVAWSPISPHPTEHLIESPGEFVSEIGREPLFAFRFPDGHISINTRSALRKELKSRIREIERHPYLMLDVLEFLGDASGAKEQVTKIAARLAAKNRRIAAEWEKVQLGMLTPAQRPMSTVLQYHAIGRRKTSVARVYLRPGLGEWIVNGRALEAYLPRQALRTAVVLPLTTTDTEGQFDVKVTVQGGGIRGQADAIRLGVARALLKVNGEFRARLRSEGLLTRDPREVERKKPGRPGARKRFQFSKR